MVAAKDEEVFWVLDLVRKQKADGLERLLSSIDVVSEEQVVGFRWETAILEEAQKVVVLAVYITTNLNKIRISEEPTGYRNAAPGLDPGLTFIGASSSSRMGWEMKISRAFVHRKRISVSSSCTCFPGRLPLTSSSLSMMESRSTSFWSPMAASCCWAGSYVVSRRCPPTLPEAKTYAVVFARLGGRFDGVVLVLLNVSVCLLAKVVSWHEFGN